MSNAREQFRNRFSYLTELIVKNKLDEFKIVIKMEDLSIKFNYASPYLRIPFTGTIASFCATYFRYNFIEHLLEKFIIPNKQMNVDDVFQLGRTIAIINSHLVWPDQEKIKQIIKLCVACQADLHSKALEEVPEDFLQTITDSPGCVLS